MMPVARSDVDRLDFTLFDRSSKDFEWAGMGFQPVAGEERPATKTAALCFSPIGR